MHPRFVFCVSHRAGSNVYVSTPYYPQFLKAIRPSVLSYRSSWSMSDHGDVGWSGISFVGAKHCYGKVLAEAPRLNNKDRWGYILVESSVDEEATLSRCYRSSVLIP
jgi:hypothetical protein